MHAAQGLTESDTVARRQRGEGNDVTFRRSRCYWDIARANLFKFFNNLLFAIRAVLVAFALLLVFLIVISVSALSSYFGLLNEIPLEFPIIVAGAMLL
jgi:hypothetical protein